MTKPTVSEIASAIRAAVGDLTDDERRIVVATYRLLADGDPVPVRSIAARAGVAEPGVHAFLDAKPGVYRDEDGSVVGFWGLAIPEMPHRFQAEGGKPIHAWCALDPFLIVPVLGRSATVESTDPVTGQTVTMTVTPDAVVDVSPPDAVTSLLVPEGEFDHDIIQTFCHYVLNFASSDSGEAWAAEHDATLICTVQEAFEIGRQAWSPIIDAAARVG